MKNLNCALSVLIVRDHGPTRYRGSRLSVSTLTGRRLYVARQDNLGLCDNHDRAVAEFWRRYNLPLPVPEFRAFSTPAGTYYVVAEHLRRADVAE